MAEVVNRAQTERFFSSKIERCGFGFRHWAEQHQEPKNGKLGRDEHSKNKLYLNSSEIKLLKEQS